MSRPQCKEPNCTKDALSLSDFCGDHADAAAYVKKIENHAEREIANFYMHDIVLEKAVFSDTDYEYANISDVVFNDAIFRDCRFYCSQFTDNEFINCTFENCVFEEGTEFQTCDFSSTKFYNVKFLEAHFNLSNFQEKCEFISCNFDNLNLTGADFNRSIIGKTNFTQVFLNQTSFNQSALDTVFFTESEFSKVTFWDSSLVLCAFNDVTHDFKQQTDSIELCYLKAVAFNNTEEPENLGRWNGVEEPIQTFYERVIRQILETAENIDLQYVDNLTALRVAVQRLDEIGVSDHRLKRQVKEIFRLFFALASEKKDLAAFGSIAQYLSGIPKDWIDNITGVLPSGEDQLPGEGERYGLKLVFHTNDTSLEKARNIFDKLHRLERVLMQDIPGNKLQIRSLRIGSFEAYITGNVELIITIAEYLTLGGGALVILNGYKSWLEIQKLRLERKKELNASTIDLDLKQLEKIKLEEEIKILRLERQSRELQILKERAGFEPAEVISEEVRADGMEIGRQLLEESDLDTLDLYVETIEERMRE